MPFISHTKAEISAMLSTLNVKTTAALFDEVPNKLQVKELAGVPEGVSEMALTREMQQRAQQDNYQLNFIGAGAYEHHIPAAVWSLVSRGEFLTAYTPYQAEASQGTLQVLYEYQTMMSRLLALEVSNASLYDGASALAEAVLMAARVQKNSKAKGIIIPETLHPAYRETVHTIVETQGFEIISLPMDAESGIIDYVALQNFNTEGCFCVVIPQPNFLGQLETVDEIVNWAGAQKLATIAVVNPIAMALLKPPGEWGSTGVDIACGEGQPLGVPLASGGPYFGFLCCKNAFMRQIPGRIVGRTLDAKGKSGFTLTLQAREQHIRRAKATSNICTNQGLLVTAATIYMSLLGVQGLYEVAATCYLRGQQLRQALSQQNDVKVLYSDACFHELVFTTPKPAKKILDYLAQIGIEGGISLEKSHYMPEAILCCVTETKTPQDIQQYVTAIQAAIADSN